MQQLSGISAENISQDRVTIVETKDGELSTVGRRDPVLWETVEQPEGSHQEQIH